METRCDPAGDLRELVTLRAENAALWRLLAQARRASHPHADALRPPGVE